MSAHLYPDLDTFLTALRFDGFAVGPHEIVRLQHVFRQAPQLDHDALQNLLACTLVKHQDQRRRFDALFDDSTVRTVFQRGSRMRVSIL